MPEMLWGWLVILYLWLGGTAAGTYVAGSLIHRLSGGRDAPLLKVTTYIAFPMFWLAGILLTIHLGRPGRFLYPLTTFRLSSSMSLGTWLIALWGLLGVLLVGRYLLEDLRGRGIIRVPALETLGIWVGVPLGVLFVAYSGVLFGETFRPMWRGTPLLAALFVASAFSGGVAVLASGLSLLRLVGSEDLRRRLAGAVAGLIALQVLVIALFVVWLSLSASAPLQRASALMVSGPLALWFWGGVVFLGLLVPMGLETWAARGRGPAAVSILAMLLVVLGGLALRYTVVMGGQMVGYLP